MALIGLALLGLALLLWGVARRMQARTGLPYAPIRYDDASAQQVPERPLISRRYRLVGRPDFLLAQQRHMIPVEVKPTRRAAAPYESDLMQVAAYCLLVEETYGQAPPYGVLRYADRTWTLPFDAAVRARLLATLAAMDLAEASADVSRSHQQPARCARCSQRSVCGQQLV